MNMSISSRILLAGAASVLVLAACNDNAASPSASSSAAKPESITAAAKEPAAATINGIAIPESRVALLAKNMAAQGHAPEDANEARKLIIEQLTMQMLISQEATKTGLDKKAEIQEQLDLMRQSVLANAFIQNHLATQQITDEAVKTEYDRLQTQLSGNEFKARHILVADEALAKELSAKLKKDPKAFAALAKAHSIDPGSKERGGDLGWFNKGSMVPEFGDAVAKLEKGKITEEPVKSKFGYHIIALDDTRKRDFPPIDDVKPAIKQQLAKQSVQKLIEDLKAKAKIEIAAAPATPATPATPAAQLHRLAPAAPADKK
jgi:peptidyl-prolyl cis-trans isomerase C